MRMVVSILIAGFAAVSLQGQQSDTTKLAAAEGSIRGSLHDAHGAVLPGVAITAASGDVRKTVVTDVSGAYDLGALPIGRYTVTAKLNGFVTGVRGDVSVHSAEPTRVDFVLCLGGLEYIDWIAQPDLRALWTKADIVARVEIASTRSVPSECGQSNFVDTATIRELLKNERGRVSGPTLTFIQENWAEERTPYAVGQQLIVFLVETPRGLSRVTGPWSTFYVTGDTVRGLSTRFLGATGTMAVDDFMAQLRVFEKRES